MKPNLFLNTARFYDADLASIAPEDLPFYQELIPSGSSVLELGCGTGRVALTLAKAGCQVTGLDLSDQMLDLFRAKLEKPEYAGLDINLIKEDMADFDLDQHFDWIIFPFRTFQGLFEDHDRRTCLRSVIRHMNETSMAVITMFDPLQPLLDEWGVKGNVDFTLNIEGTDKYLRRLTDQTNHNKSKQIIEAELIYQIFQGDEILEEHRDLLRLGYLFPSESRQLFKQEGFLILEEYSTYDFQPLIEIEQKEQIFVLQRSWLK